MMALCVDDASGEKVTNVPVTETVSRGYEYIICSANGRLLLACMLITN